MGWLTGLLGGAGMTVLLAVITPIFLYVMKKIPNEWIKGKVGTLAYGLGVAVTLGLSKWKWTASLWNKTIEVYFIDLIDNTIVCFAENFIKGMRSD